MIFRQKTLDKIMIENVNHMKNIEKAISDAIDAGQQYFYVRLNDNSSNKINKYYIKNKKYLSEDFICAYINKYIGYNCYKLWNEVKINLPSKYNIEYTPSNKDFKNIANAINLAIIKHWVSITGIDYKESLREFLSINLIKCNDTPFNSILMVELPTILYKHKDSIAKMVIDKFKSQSEE